MKSRYYFFKRLFPEYVVLLNNKTLGWDNKLKDFIKNEDINYVIVDSNNQVQIKEFKVNNYRFYVMRIFLKEYLSSFLNNF